MGVYDKEGTLEYLIEPSKDYPNSTMVYDGNPEIIPEKVNLDIYNFKYNGLDYKEYSTFKDYKIKCKSLKPNGEIEIFLSYRGEIRPCCFIGVDLDKHSLGGYNTQLKEIFNYDCNLNTNSLDNILDFFDKKIKDKWDDTFENGKCIKCSMMCGASSQIDHSRLYENIEI
jgi:hypothetical protein